MFPKKSLHSPEDENRIDKKLFDLISPLIKAYLNGRLTLEEFKINLEEVGVLGMVLLDSENSRPNRFSIFCLVKDFTQESKKALNLGSINNKLDKIFQERVDQLKNPIQSIKHGINPFEDGVRGICVESNNAVLKCIYMPVIIPINTEEARMLSDEILNRPEDFIKLENGILE